MSTRMVRSLVAVAAVIAVVAGVVVRTKSSDPGAPLELADPDDTFDPVAAGATLPEGYRLALPRDSILPVYEPAFTDAAGVDWPGDMLVIGVAGASEAKAYPLTHLNSREMVNDTLEGTPILVSW